ncbi:hypothetical protein Acor_03930 [Acrocarpospora corrugata]|uniref:Uncharacterized protein n=1 Tax=Acrocarpospora corrugata TaxID=35763 RepID=A0A5M3VRV3_9ACTN|nr:hypothetical protein Acor_03930 [Acrocarpospora corrugata]
MVIDNRSPGRRTPESALRRTPRAWLFAHDWSRKHSREVGAAVPTNRDISSGILESARGSVPGSEAGILGSPACRQAGGN